MSLNNKNLVLIEKEILKKWEKSRINMKKLATNTSEYILFDGPPFANGLPHYGHLLTGFIKDFFCRYNKMQNKKVLHNIGWDCHGLPVELHVEKLLKISGKYGIRKFGIKKFNRTCRNSVLSHIEKWKEYFYRQARLSLNEEYRTMNLKYMESVIWGFNSLYRRKMIYKSMKVMPYSWACESTVSDFETKIDDSYRLKTTIAITFKMKLNTLLSFYAKKDTNIFFLIWSTTPWTIPSNLAIAINKDIKYSLVNNNNELYIIANSLVRKYYDIIGNKIIINFTGNYLLQEYYSPIFNYLLNNNNSFRVLNGNFVDDKYGTGVVHIAPEFGEDDYNICNENSINSVCTVDSQGKFNNLLYDLKGKIAVNSSSDIIKILNRKKVVMYKENYLHKYPHCWRTDTPLIYKTVSSWYLKSKSIKKNIISNNKKINWFPGHIKEGLFGKWLKNIKDWAISRNRFWGCPIPIWESDDKKFPNILIYSSIKELENKFNIKINNLHRPFIDSLISKNYKDTSSRSKMRRIREILDCWFESSCMSFSKLNYPFKNNVKLQLTSDFVVEYLSQTRGWFYTMIVMSTSLFNKVPFLNCICHGIIIGKNKKKLSKKLNNYSSLKKMFEKYGSDVLRTFMLSSNIMNGEELIVSNVLIDETNKKYIQPFLNTCKFFSLYYNIDKTNIKNNMKSKNILDQYIVSKLFILIKNSTKDLNNYNTIAVVKEAGELLNIINNWYIRRGKERFWSAKRNIDKSYAYSTLFFLISNISRLMFPFMPILTEAIYKKLILKSINLEKFPLVVKIRCNYKLASIMDKIREACRIALCIRNEHKIKIRQPLKKVIFLGINIKRNKYLKKIILEEINVKVYRNLKKREMIKYINHKLKINFFLLAKKNPRKIKNIIHENTIGNWKKIKNKIKISNIFLKKEEYKISIEPKNHFETKISNLNNILVHLDTKYDIKLSLETTARDFTRIIQQTRKYLRLNLTKLKTLKIIILDEDSYKAILKWNNNIERKTLCIINRKNNFIPKFEKIIGINKNNTLIQVL